jgi:hypothetical protein
VSMSRELARKRPANANPLPRAEILTATVHQKAVLLAEVHALARRGEIGHTYDLRPTSQGWAVKVMRIAERPSWWSRNGLRASLWAAGGLGAGTGLVLLVRAVLILLAGALPFLVGGGIVLGLLSLVAGPRVINIVQRVDIK